MALQYIYMILRPPNQLDSDVVEWAGTHKWNAVAFLEERVSRGHPLAEFKVIRMKENQPLTMTYVDVYEFMSVDPGEVS